MKKEDCRFLFPLIISFLVIITVFFSLNEVFSHNVADDLNINNFSEQGVKNDSVKSKIVKSSPFYYLPDPQRSNDPKFPGPIPCEFAQVACSANTYTFPSGTDGWAPDPVAGYPNYGCLGQSGGHYAPGPAWYFMQVGTAGSITMTITQWDLGFPPQLIDVDFICWGPFTSLTQGCATGLTAGNIADCSFLPDPIEICQIPNAQVGDMYILLMSNWNGAPGTITFHQTGGIGQTNCTIVSNCSVLAITTNPSACDVVSNTFSVSGNIEFTNPIPTGTFTITDNTAVPPVSQTFSPPYTSPMAYTLPGILCDGAVHSLTATFSDEVTCTFTQTFTAPSENCPSAVISGGGNVCDDGISLATVNINISGAPSPYTFTYALNGVSQTPVTNYSGPIPYQINTMTPGLYTLVSVSNLVCTGGGTVSGSATVTLVPLPHLTNIAPSPICSGVTFHADLTMDVATPVNPGFTWTASCSPAGAVTGFSNNILPGILIISQVLTNTTTAPATVTYTITPHANGCNGIAVPYTVTVNPAAHLTNAAPVAICSGSTFHADLTMDVATPVNPGFTWTASCSPAVAVTGFSNNILPGILVINQALTNTTSAPATVTYTITPHANGCDGVTVPFTVIVNPTAHLTNAAPGPTCSGTSFHADLTMDVTSPINPGFTWTAGCSPAGAVTGFSDNSLPLIMAINQVLANTTTAPATVTYTITPHANGCDGVAVPFTVTVNPAVHLTNTAPSPICSGATFHTDLTMDVTTPTNPGFTWTASCSPAGAVTGFSDNSLPLILAINQALTNTTTAPATVTYTITPHANGCDGVNLPFTVTVNPIAHVTNAAPSPICSGATFNANLTMDVTAPVNPGFTWTASCSPAGSVTGFSNNSLPGIFNINQVLTNTTPALATVTYIITPHANGCDGVAVPLTITVNPTAHLTNAAPSPICSGATFNANLTMDVASPVNPGFTWTASCSPAGAVTGFSNNALPLILAINQALTNTTTALATVTYTITPHANGCDGVTVAFTVTVNPTAHLTNAAPNPICSLATFHADLTMDITTPVNPGFTWTASCSPAGAVTGFSDNSLPLILAINQVLTNTTAVPATVTYTITPHTNGCDGVTVPFTLTVNPTASFLVTGLNDLCAGSSNISYSTTAGMITYSWTVSAGGTTSGPTNTNSLIVNWNSNATSAQSVTVNYTNSVLCVGTTIYPVTVHPLPVATFPGNTTVCQLYPAPYTYTADPGPACSYSWSVIPIAGGSGSIVNSSANPASIIWNTPGTASLRLDALTSYSCSSLSSQTITINPKPDAIITSCFDVVTNRSAKTFLLKGGQPLSSTPLQGEYLISPATPALYSDAGGNFYFDPKLVAGNSNQTFQISYRYTSSQLCPATSPTSVSITVRPANSIICSASMTDYRESPAKTYPTALVNGKCWMTENLSYGQYTQDNLVQTDNCVVQKYCQDNDLTKCSAAGGYYQWNELIQYGITSYPYQGLCPPGWHLPTAVEWQDLIDNQVNPGNGLAGGDLKSPGFGFDALLNGMYYQNYTWRFTSGTLTATMFWTSTTSGTVRAVARGLNNYSSGVLLYPSSRANAFPVRCVKD